MKNNRIMKLLLLSICLVFNLIFTCHSLYFDLKNKNTKCFIEELYSSNMAMIKYSVLGLSGENPNEQKILNHISIKVFNEENLSEIFIDKYLVSREGKLSMTAPEDGQYRVCVTSSNTTNERLKMHIQIISDNMDEPNLANALKREVVYNINDKIETITKISSKYAKKQSSIIKLEDEDSKNIMKSQKMFFYMTMLQITLVIFIGIYQIRNFKNYMDKNILDF